MSSWEEYVSDTEEVPGHNVKAVLRDQIKRLQDAETQVAELEEALKLAKARVRQLTEYEIPNTFETLGIDPDSKIRVDGYEVTVVDKISASPKAADREKVYDWLEENGHTGLIKRKAVFDVGRDDVDKVQEWMTGVEGYRGEFERRVEPQTLSAFVRSQVADGKEIPTELFGMRSVRTVKVKAG